MHDTLKTHIILSIKSSNYAIDAAVIIVYYSHLMIWVDEYYRQFWPFYRGAGWFVDREDCVSNSLNYIDRVIKLNWKIRTFRPKCRTRYAEMHVSRVPWRIIYVFSSEVLLAILSNGICECMKERAWKSEHERAYMKERTRSGDGRGVERVAQWTNEEYEKIVRNPSGRSSSWFGRNKTWYKRKELLLSPVIE